MTRDRGQVMELQGLYGPFQFSELLLQRIWAERSFCLDRAQTMAGEAVQIDAVGRWNRQGGPDFKGARIRIGARWVHGDVELHLHEADWRAHQHARDPAYDDVVLHVVLFPPRRPTTEGVSGRALPVLALLPLLWHDLEEYAADAAISAIAARPADQLAEAWLQWSEAERTQHVLAGARRRWEAKVRYARLRIERLGWEAACHHTALEILGYRFNRAPMLELAGRWPLAEWDAAAFSPEACFEALVGRWSLQGVRPANHPRKRLHAYLNWVRAAVGRNGESWPTTLARLAMDWPEGESEIDPAAVRAWRQEAGWAAWRQEVVERLGLVGAVARPRLDNLWGDGLLPLLAAHDEGRSGMFQPWWFQAWPGDQPAALVKAARLVGLSDGGRRRPLAWGHVQALLGWLHATDATARAPDLRRT